MDRETLRQEMAKLSNDLSLIINKLHEIVKGDLEISVEDVTLAEVLAAIIAANTLLKAMKLN